MRPSATRIPLLLLLLLPLSASAMPHQRRGPVLLESVAGPSEARLADTTSREPAPPPRTSEPASSGAPAPAKAETEEEALLDEAMGPLPKKAITLPPEEAMARPPEDTMTALPDADPAAVQAIKDAWHARGDAARPEIQARLDTLAEQAEQRWRARDLAINMFRWKALYQRNRRARVRKQAGPASLRPSPRISQILEQKLALERNSIATVNAHLKASNNARRLRDQAWIVGMSKGYGTKPRGPYSASGTRTSGSRDNWP